MVGVLHFPDVCVKLGLCCHYLAAVNDRSAAHGQYEVNVVLAHHFCPFLHHGIGRVWHDAAKVEHVFAAFVQPALYLVVQARSFERTATVCQQHICARVAYLFFYCAFGAPLAKVLAYGILESEIVHVAFLLFIVVCCEKASLRLAYVRRMWQDWHLAAAGRPFGPKHRHVCHGRRSSFDDVDVPEPVAYFFCR